MRYTLRWPDSSTVYAAYRPSGDTAIHALGMSRICSQWSGGRHFCDEPPAGGRDLHKPDPTLRDRSLVGTDFILNFEFTDGKWKHGRIYNPENGKQYKADLEFKDGVLKVRGWIGIRWLGRTVEWTRLD